MKTGLKELPKDTRDYKLGAIISIKKFPKLKDLPDKFILETSDLKDQVEDFCTGNTIALLIGTNEGFPCDENWSFAKSKELSGDPNEWGQDMRTAFQVGVKIGALPKTNSPFGSEKGHEFLRDIKNWPSGLEFFALPQKQKTFWAVSGPYDIFDNIKGTIYYLNSVLKQKQGVGLGILWGWTAEQYTLDKIKEQGEGHAISCIGWEGDYLILQNSWGKNAGLNGKHLISREVVNHFAGKYGAYVYLDLPKEKAKQMLENNIKLTDNWLIAFFKTIWNLFFGNRTFGASRSSQWRIVRAEYINNNPKCEICGKKGLLRSNEVHHIKPFHLFPDLELNPINFITLCRTCHLSWGHLFSFKSYNENVRIDVLRIKNRP